MSALITPVKAARKRYPCAWDCGSDIEPGQSYVRWALPPWTDGNHDDHWWSGTAHGRFTDQCPTFVHGSPSAAMDVVERATN